MFITSVQNPRVKDAVKLRDRKHRASQRRTLVDGAREILLAIQSGAPIVELFVCDELCRSAESRALLARAEELKIPHCEVSPPVFEKLAFGARAEGVLAVVETRSRRLDAWPAETLSLVAVVDHVEKPGNLGAILRSADAAGLHGVIVTDGRTDVDNPNAIRASLGTTFTVRIAEASAVEARAWLQTHGFQILAARVDAPRLYTEVDLTRPTAILLGSESQGLAGDWSGPDIVPIRLPMLGLADSLNVSATAAVLFYEAWRQRHPR